MKKTVLVRGPLLSNSGYGTHCRQIFSYFLKNQDKYEVSTQILNWGITPWCVNTEKENGIYGEIISRNRKIETKFDMTVQIQLPNEWDENLGNFNIGVTAGVETDKCSKEWATTHRNKMNLLIVPSIHTKFSFLNSGTGKETTPIVVVPESYFSELDCDVKEQPFEFKTKKNFLTIGMFTADESSLDRKNIINTIRWFCQEFSDRKDVGLIVKTSKGRETTIDRELVRKTLVNVIQQSGVKNPPPVYMLHGLMSRQDMNSLYKHPDIIGFVSATRGEGFGLPMLEAAVSGLPVVCTEWSSVTEFLTGKSFLGVDYDLVSLPDKKIDGNIFVKEAKWANPRESSFKRQLRKLDTDHATYRSSAKFLSEILKNTHNSLKIENEYEKIFKKLENKWFYFL